MKKLLALLLTLVLALTVLAGCGQEEPAPIHSIPYDITAIPPEETAAVIDGREIPAQHYFYWLGYSCGNLEYQIHMLNSYYGIYSELFLEDGSIDWSASLEDGQTLSQLAKDRAASTVSYYAAIDALAEEHGVSLTQEDLDAIEADRASAVESLGGEDAYADYLYQTGLTQEGFTRINAAAYLYQHLLEQVGQEGSGLYLDPADYDQYRTYADHILLLTQDQATGEALSDEEIAEKRSLMEDLLAQLRSSGDPAALFAQLADQYSEDPGRASYPDGYIFSSGEMVQEFEDAAAALAPGEISGIIETSYGYHILLRKDLAEGLASDETGILEDMRVEHLDQLLADYGQKHPLEVTEAADAVDAGTYYTQFTAAVDAAKAAREAQQQAESGEAGDGADGAAEPSDAPGE